MLKMADINEGDRVVQSVWAPHWGAAACRTGYRATVLSIGRTRVKVHFDGWIGDHAVNPSALVRETDWEAGVR